MEFAPRWNDFHETPDEFDNPDDEEFVQLYNIRALTAETVSLDPDACETDGAYKCAVFDMTCTDSDCSWTMAPDLLNHVRAFEHVGGDMDIILDSGADGSALPLCFGEVGRAVRPGQHVVYVDAQGDPLNIANTRKATVDCGDTSLEEEFLIASVTSPLLSLGRLMKQGWIINTDDAGPHLWNGTSRIPITFKRNSLCIKGMIRMVEQSDEPPMDEMQVRAITLSENLSAVKTSWKKLGEACFAIRTYKPFFVDTTMAPAELFLWYRTTLVKRDSTWDVIEYNQLISDFADSMTGPIVGPGEFEEAITIGHGVQCTPEQIGFSVEEPHGAARPLDTPVQAGQASSSSSDWICANAGQTR